MGKVKSIKNTPIKAVREVVFIRVLTRPIPRDDALNHLILTSFSGNTVPQARGVPVEFATTESKY